MGMRSGKSLLGVGGPRIQQRVKRASRLGLAPSIWVRRRAQTMYTTPEESRVIPPTPETVASTPTPDVCPRRPPTAEERRERVHELQCQALRRPDPLLASLEIMSG